MMCRLVWDIRALFVGLIFDNNSTKDTHSFNRTIVKLPMRIQNSQFYAPDATQECHMIHRTTRGIRRGTAADRTNGIFVIAIYRI
uniref:Putative secreted protein n=1 Tax=Anopheles marajoara TaxID=58244 RepID=A0A2M4CBA1_9DIPT